MWKLHILVLYVIGICGIDNTIALFAMYHCSAYANSPIFSHVASSSLDAMSDRNTESVGILKFMRINYVNKFDGANYLVTQSWYFKSEMKHRNKLNSKLHK